MWLNEKNLAGEWELSMKTLSEIARKIAYSNVKLKINKQ
jgi:hypothetical protein